MTDRRSQLVAAILLLVAAVALWGASRMTWATVAAEDSLDLQQMRTFSVLGSDWSPWLIAVAAVFVAALAVQFAVHGLALRVVAIGVALLGVAVAVPAISLLASGDGDLYAARAIDLPDRFDVIAVSTTVLPGITVLLAALCAVLAAVAILRTASSGRRMSSKYSTPAARREDIERQAFADYERRKAQESGAADESASTERELWEALDHGIDPTDETGRGGADGR